VKSNVKTLLIYFFDANGIVHLEFIPNGQTVNQAFYLQVLKRLHDTNAPSCGKAGSGGFTTTTCKHTKP